jgi:hypothetical protein
VLQQYRQYRAKLLKAIAGLQTKANAWPYSINMSPAEAPPVMLTGLGETICTALS